MKPLVSVLIAFSAAIGSIIALLRGRVLVMDASVGDLIAWAMGGRRALLQHLFIAIDLA